MPGVRYPWLRCKPPDPSREESPHLRSVGGFLDERVGDEITGFGTNLPTSLIFYEVARCSGGKMLRLAVYQVGNGHFFISSPADHCQPNPSLPSNCSQHETLIRELPTSAVDCYCAPPALMSRNDPVISSVPTSQRTRPTLPTIQQPYDNIYCRATEESRVTQGIMNRKWE